jgi:hypothetical protein
VSQTPIAQEIRGSIDKRDWIKLKDFCTAKETITRQSTKWETMFVSYSLDRLNVQNT